MVIDLHVHVSAFTPGHGLMSRHLLDSWPFRMMRWCFNIRGEDERTERQVESQLAETILGTPELDAAVVLAFDAVYTETGEFDAANTHLYVTNDYIIELCRRHPRMLFGCSVNPYRKDAVKELERCIAAGAVLMKWLPLTQGFDPSDPRCFPLYEAMAHHGLPLLSHTGGEQALPILSPETADPRLLIPALERGVTVIAAHCATRSSPRERTFVREFIAMTHEHEKFYGDTAGLNLPTRWHGWDALLDDDVARGRLVHGSDWPIISIPPVQRLGTMESLELMCERNWMRRDVLTKRRLGLGDEYWRRAAVLLQFPSLAETSRAAEPRSGAGE
ncbi:MAG: amidohydrolase family protein [Tepidisphaeraceae bacterium]|jgi:predicted TIM-barrel fold metal-dependent hydrolase